MVSLREIVHAFRKIRIPGSFSSRKELSPKLEAMNSKESEAAHCRPIDCTELIETTPIATPDEIFFSHGYDDVKEMARLEIFVMPELYKFLDQCIQLNDCLKVLFRTRPRAHVVG